MAARDRLGGLAEESLAAMVLLRALYDVVILETVGVGQSETDVADCADTVVFCVQPGAGDSLQFMKAGIVEIPHIVAVTKTDMGVAAARARVRLRPLAAYREPARVTVAANRFDIFQPLDVLADFAAELALDGEAFGELADFLFLVAGELAALFCETHADLFENLAGARRADAINKRQGVRELFVIRNGDAGDTHKYEKIND